MMMLRAIDNFYDEQEEPVKSCLGALRNIILNYHPELTEAWKYRLPCFCYHGKIFCYLWIDKKTKHPYISVSHGSKINHPMLVAGTRTVFKILPIDPEQDIPIESIDEIFQMVLEHHQSKKKSF